MCTKTFVAVRSPETIPCCGILILAGLFIRASQNLSKRTAGFFLAIARTSNAAFCGRREPCSQLRIVPRLVFRSSAKSRWLMRRFLRIFTISFGGIFRGREKRVTRKSCAFRPGTPGCLPGLPSDPKRDSCHSPSFANSARIFFSSSVRSSCSFLPNKCCFFLLAFCSRPSHWNLRLSLTRRSLTRFAKSMMPSCEAGPCHQFILDYSERLLFGDIRKLWISTPPRHGKSTAGSIMLPAFALGRNPPRNHHPGFVRLRLGGRLPPSCVDTKKMIAYRLSDRATVSARKPVLESSPASPSGADWVVFRWEPLGDQNPPCSGKDCGSSDRFASFLRHTRSSPSQPR